MPKTSTATTPKKKNQKSDSSIVFFGTPRFATGILDELESAGIVPDIIVTAPDRPAGRGLEMQAPPVKEWAVTRDIPVLQPESLKDDNEAVTLLKNSEWDLFLLAAYGKILPKDILALPRRGTLNVHPSLLPKFRGASPIEAQILADDRDCGVSIMLMDEAMDHGPVVAQASITPDPWPVREHVLEALLAHEGGSLLAEVIPDWLDESLTPEPQDHVHATFTKKIKKEDGLIDLPTGRQASPEEEYKNYLKFCAYDEWPGTYFFQDGMRIKIVDAKFENNTFTPLRVIPEGKKERDFTSPAS